MFEFAAGGMLFYHLVSGLQIQKHINVPILILCGCVSPFIFKRWEEYRVCMDGSLAGVGVCMHMPRW